MAAGKKEEKRGERSRNVFCSITSLMGVGKEKRRRDSWERYESYFACVGHRYRERGKKKKRGEGEPPATAAATQPHPRGKRKGERKEREGEREKGDLVESIVCKLRTFHDPAVREGEERKKRKKEKKGGGEGKLRADFCEEEQYVEIDRSEKKKKKGEGGRGGKKKGDFHENSPSIFERVSRPKTRLRGKKEKKKKRGKGECNMAEDYRTRTSRLRFLQPRRKTGFCIAV